MAMPDWEEFMPKLVGFLPGKIPATFPQDSATMRGT
jgi:hypothetical protein